jgi:hypothetical protein
METSLFIGGSLFFHTVISGCRLDNRQRQSTSSSSSGGEERLMIQTVAVPQHRLLVSLENHQVSPAIAQVFGPSAQTVRFRFTLRTTHETT